ncbi:TrmH family RNA methyltransferase [Bizionia argentinensis JUB59]|uniref:TrmH family RNA methyltransferase n=1 Tax=Bizionia argentinensis JUB59 TaxID=1046627 RepID=G2E939_9FLAO|nr:TrmH family RNA methyltransferase [Bizionia argentinensis]EGV44984.1 TrmH family RNA methyltransferase [Bizionia argentinensis JUB59]
MQLTHYTTKFTPHTFPITIVCDNITNAPNIGSIFRTADAFGIEKLIFCGSDMEFGRKSAKTSRATEKYVSHEFNENILETVTAIKASGYYMVALEITEESQSINKIVFPINQPIALIVGAENFGISETILELADAVIHINMYGQNSSMNVVQATNICLYEMTKQLLQK